MKSPMSKVGIIEAEGILKGSATNDRNSRTTRNMGKKERAVSTRKGSRAVLAVSAEVEAFPSPLLLAGANFQASTAQMRPLLKVRKTSNAEKSKFMVWTPWVQHNRITPPCLHVISP